MSDKLPTIPAEELGSEIHQIILLLSKVGGLHAGAAIKRLCEVREQLRVAETYAASRELGSSAEPSGPSPAPVVSDWGMSGYITVLPKDKNVEPSPAVTPQTPADPPTER